VKNVEGLDMSKRILYERQGRRYVAVHEYDPAIMDGLPQGDHLISVYPGGRSYRYNVTAALAPMIAAGRLAEDAVSQALVKASEMRAHRRPITEAQRLAWENLSKAFGDERYYVEIPSAREVAQAGIEALQAEAERLLTDPNVQRAYQRFLFVCELTRKHDV
jgi:hypothetical protein